MVIKGAGSGGEGEGSGERGGGKRGERGREAGREGEGRGEREGEGSGDRGGGKRGERGREAGIGYPPVHPHITCKLAIRVRIQHVPCFNEIMYLCIYLFIIFILLSFNIWIPLDKVCKS